MTSPACSSWGLGPAPSMITSCDPGLPAASSCWHSGGNTKSSRPAITSVITYPESCSALGRRARQSLEDDARLEEWLAALNDRWSRAATPEGAPEVAGPPATQHGLKGMDEVKPEFPQAEFALVIGANDVTNPAARTDTSSPIYGMPILDVDKAAAVVVMKRSMAPGFAGIDNELYLDPRTTMLFGDAKDSIVKLIGAVKAS